MPTQGTFRSSPWALTWPIKSISTNPLAAWSHQSEKLKMNAESQGFDELAHPDVKDERWWRSGHDNSDSLSFYTSRFCFVCLFFNLFLVIMETRRDLLCVYLLMLLPCFWKHLIYKCIHSDVHNDNQIRIVQPSSTYGVLPVIPCNISCL